jgi:acyl-CoA thioester hydrolase
MLERSFPIRWRDLDGYGHVNNAVYLTYLEEVRDPWLVQALGGEPQSSWDFVLARVAIDFRRELRLEDARVTARCELVRIGRSSITTREHVLAAEGWLAAEAESVLVARDREGGASRPLRDHERAALERERG